MKPLRVPRRRSLPVPRLWRDEIASVLIGEDEIRRRVGRLARELTRDFARRDLVIVAVLTGTVMFLGDLLRRLALPVRLDFIGVSSYRDGTEPGELVVDRQLRVDVRGRDVLIVDDILDTGRTLARVHRTLEAMRPGRIRTCILLEKTARRVERVRADYVGFQIPDLFVVGYGLDF